MQDNNSERFVFQKESRQLWYPVLNAEQPEQLLPEKVKENNGPHKEKRECDGSDQNTGRRTGCPISKMVLHEVVPEKRAGVCDVHGKSRRSSEFDDFLWQGTDFELGE